MTLSSLAELPVDDRTAEVAAALTFTALAGLILLLELGDAVDFLLPGDIPAPPLQAVLAGLLAGFAYDRYSLAGSALATLSRGFSRLFERDLQRECTAESASFLVGYILGLPCMAFMPTAARPIDLLIEAGKPMAALCPAPARLIDRLLIWQLAPVAAEHQAYADMLVSSPKIANEMLQAARRREASLGIDVQEGGWQPDADEERVRWAYSEARRLLKRFSGAREELQDQMAAGVSVGQCVVLLEERLKGQWSLV